MKDELIAIEQIGRGSWFINGQEIVWDHFPKEGIHGFDRRGNLVLITPEWLQHPKKELLSVTIIGMSYAYLDNDQRKFWLSKHQFVIYFLGVPGTPSLFRFKDNAISQRLEQDIFQPLSPLCE